MKNLEINTMENLQGGSSNPTATCVTGILSAGIAITGIILSGGLGLAGALAAGSLGLSFGGISTCNEAFN